MGVKLVTPQPQREEHDYRGRALPDMPEKYRGDMGQERWMEDTYRATECDAVIDRAITQARMRLARGDDVAEVEAWLCEQATQASEDEAERRRFGRRSSLTLSDNPKATRAACAASLARVVVLDFQRRRR